MTRTRLKVAAYWLSGRRNNVTLKELLTYILSRSYACKAANIIQSVNSDSEHLVVKLKGLKDNLYYPSTMSLHSLEQVVVESFFEDNWHYYQGRHIRLEPSDTVVDCGAAEGIFSLLAANNVRQVYVVEPHPVYVKALARTFEGRPNVHILSCAVSDADGRMSLADAELSSALIQTGGENSIEVSTIDKLFYEKSIPVSFLKADLEGYDYKALKGAEQTIDRYSPKIAVTTYHEADHCDLIYALLRNINPKYRIEIKGIYQESGAPIMLRAWCDK